MRGSWGLLKGQLAGARTSQQCRRALPLSLRAMLGSDAPIFQPYNDTAQDRYPQVFAALADDRDDLSVLSFGCSTGEELTTLRSYFPRARIVGLEAGRSNVADARRRTSDDARIEVKRAVSTADEPSSSYDLIFAMAVFRHGALSGSGAATCLPFLDFGRFDEAVTDMVRCLRPGGRLVVEHTNFRVQDARAGRSLTPVLSRPATDHDRDGSPRFGPDNLRLPPADTLDLVFEVPADASVPEAQ